MLTALHGGGFQRASEYMKRVTSIWRRGRAVHVGEGVTEEELQRVGGEGSNG